MIRGAARVRSFLERPGAGRSERGATAVEYALMLGLVAIVIIASVTILGRNLSTLFRAAAVSL
ncbi:Flp family type IVb pilin [Arthrobacter sp. NEB 688]|nr:Flp family type IVb pilin [Arthrobacter sp. NEB 688]